MKIIEPRVELVGDINPVQILKHIELCGRVSHKSKARDDSAEQFVRMIIKRGHESVLEHASLTFHIICDRAIMAELTRHRHAAFTVESTRYVKYNELEVINPFPNDDFAKAHWAKMMSEVEKNYRLFIDVGVNPEQARAVLPNCLKTELYMTANLRSWRHILKLRTSKAAHPQMKEIMNQVLAVFKEKLPVIVEDISHE